jgi:hypothetical protein
MSNHDIIKYAIDISKLDLSNLTSNDVNKFKKIISKLYENIKSVVEFQLILTKKHALDDKYFYNHKEYYKYKLNLKKDQIPFSQLFKKSNSKVDYNSILKEVEDTYIKIDSELSKNDKYIDFLRSMSDDEVIIALSKLNEEQIREIEIIKSIKGINKTVTNYLNTVKNNLIKKNKSIDDKKRKAIDLAISLKRIN